MKFLDVGRSARLQTFEGGVEKPPTPASGSAPKSVTANRTFSVVVVDDHPVFRLGLSKLLEDEPEFVVIGSVKSAVEALAFLRQQRCDCALLDISLPGSNGIELVKQLRAEHEQLCIMLVSMHDESLYALRGLRAGAMGYVMKSAGPEAILAGLRKALRKEIAVSPSLSETLIYKAARGKEAGGESPLSCLSDRQLEIMELIGEGKDTRTISNTLHLSVKTVESHRLNIKQKLGLESAAAMVKFAMDWKRERSDPAAPTS